MKQRRVKLFAIEDKLRQNKTVLIFSTYGTIVCTPFYLLNEF